MTDIFVVDHHCVQIECLDLKCSTVNLFWHVSDLACECQLLHVFVCLMHTSCTSDSCLTLNMFGVLTNAGKQFMIASAC